MDEFKKDEILEEEKSDALQKEAAEEADFSEDVTETAEEPSAEAAEEIGEESTEDSSSEEKTELEAELEEIRDMFQKELDAARENTDSEMLIQELDHENPDSLNDEEEVQNLPLCECCGENPRSQDYGEDYLYCDSCREIMKRYPLRFSGVLTLLLSIALVIITGYFAFSSFDSSIAAADFVATAESGKTFSALQAGYSYLQETDKSTVSKKVVRMMIDSYVNTGYFTDAGTLIETYFTETELKMPWNKKYQNIVTESTVLQETYYAVSEIIEPVAMGQEYDYEEIMAELEALKSVNPKAEGKSTVTEKYNETFIEYYKYVVMSVNDESLEAQLEQLKKVDENGKGYEWCYLANLCGIAARAGDEETVNDAFDRLVSMNKQDMNAYIAKASYYRYLEKPDADKILEICAEAAANAFNGDLSYKQYEAIAYLIKGEGTLALESIEAAISSAYTVQTCNLYALCGLYTGNTAIYDEMKELLESSGYEISELVTKYKNDEISIDEIIADNGGDI